jgi:hypothetical protein
VKEGKMSTSVRVLPKIERTADGLLLVRLFDVPVNYDLTWEDAIKAGGPDTYSGSDIWRVGDKYPNAKTGVETVNISLVGFDRSWNSQEGVDYIEKVGLPAISPRESFAIGGKDAYPTLNSDLGRKYIGVVSFQTCLFGGDRRVPYSWFSDDEREALLAYFGRDWVGNDFVGLRGELP